MTDAAEPHEAYFFAMQAALGAERHPVLLELTRELKILNGTVRDILRSPVVIAYKGVSPRAVDTDRSRSPRIGVVTMGVEGKAPVEMWDVHLAPDGPGRPTMAPHARLTLSNAPERYGQPAERSSACVRHPIVLGAVRSAVEELVGHALFAALLDHVSDGVVDSDGDSLGSLRHQSSEAIWQPYGGYMNIYVDAVTRSLNGPLDRTLLSLYSELLVVNRALRELYENEPALQIELRRNTRSARAHSISGYGDMDGLKVRWSPRDYKPEIVGAIDVVLRHRRLDPKGRHVVCLITSDGAGGLHLVPTSTSQFVEQSIPELPRPSSPVGEETVRSALQCVFGDVGVMMPLDRFVRRGGGVTSASSLSPTPTGVA